ncbi:MAG: hypothetical protein NTZ85_14555 [Bacteroidia bacterium]|nr:hypothetical protein [Bacteroidia bacterium]
MTSDKTSAFEDTLAKIISVVYHPLLIPLYGLLIIFLSPTIFEYLPLAYKKILLLIVLLNNVLIPLSLIPYLKYRQLISSWFVINQKERIIPLITTSIFYFITLYIILTFKIPVFIKAFILTSAVLSSIITVINFWFKISIHSVGAGALIALVIALSVKSNDPLTLMLIAVILLAGLVLSSRLWLNSHSPKEVWLGFFLGVFTSAFLLFFF